MMGTVDFHFFFTFASYKIGNHQMKTLVSLEHWSLWITDLSALMWQSKTKRKKSWLHQHIHFYFKLKANHPKPQKPKSNLGPSDLMPKPKPWAFLEVACWESVWAARPGSCQWLFPLPPRAFPTSTPVCRDPSSAWASWLWSWPPVKDDADPALRTSLPCCCLQDPQLGWFTSQVVIFSLYLLGVLFSFRHLLTW